MFEQAAILSALIVLILFGHLGWKYYQAVEEKNNNIEIAR